MELSDFREKYHDLVKQLEEYDNKDFNAFKVLRLDRYEIRHSNFIKWLFTNEQFKKYFFEEFEKLADVNIDIAGAGEIKIEREHAFNEVDEKGKEITRCTKDKKNYFHDSNGFYVIPEYNGTGKVKIAYTEDVSERSFDDDKCKSVVRYIDINIIADTFTLTIENKIDTGEHSLQCIAYRNYMLNDPAYKDKAHYFLLLAKEMPDDFVNGRGPDGRYPGYHFMNYETIRDILLKEDVKNSFSKENGEYQVVEQYAKMIDEWTNLPRELEDICSGIESLEPFAEIKQYCKLMNSKELTETEKRFAEVARQYYLNIKKKTDGSIRIALETISQDKYYIKDDYGRGSYALAIPLKFDNLDTNKYLMNKSVLSTEDRELLKKDTKKLTSEEKAHKADLEKKIEEAKKLGQKRSMPAEKIVMRTVDYRASMSANDNPNIAFICGIKTDDSKELCKQLAENSLIEKLTEIKETDGWEISFTYYFADGSNECGDEHVRRCYAVLPAPDKINELKLDSFIGQLYVDAVLNNDYLDHLCSLKKAKIITDDENSLNSRLLKTRKTNRTLFSASDFVNKLLDYFLRDEDGIDKSLENIDTLLKTSKCSGDFERFIEKAHPIFDESKCSEIVKKLNYLGAKSVEDRLEIIKKAIKVSLFFNNWFLPEKNENYGESMKMIINALKSATKLDDIKDSKAKDIAEMFLGEKHKSKDKGNLYTDLKNKAYKVNGKRVKFGWNLDMIYYLSKSETDIQKAFRERTLEGASVFSYLKDSREVGYDEWFRDKIFKEEG